MPEASLLSSSASLSLSIFIVRCKNHTHRRQRRVLGFTGNKMLSFLVSRETVFPSFLSSLLLMLHVLIFLPQHPMQGNLGSFFDCIIISFQRQIPWQPLLSFIPSVSRFPWLPSFFTFSSLTSPLYVSLFLDISRWPLLRNEWTSPSQLAANIMTWFERHDITLLCVVLFPLLYIFWWPEKGQQETRHPFNCFLDSKKTLCPVSYSWLTFSSTLS